MNYKIDFHFYRIAFLTQLWTKGDLVREKSAQKTYGFCGMKVWEMSGIFVQEKTVGSLHPPPLELVRIIVIADQETI